MSRVLFSMFMGIDHVSSNAKSGFYPLAIARFFYVDDEDGSWVDIDFLSVEKINRLNATQDEAIRLIGMYHRYSY